MNRKIIALAAATAALALPATSFAQAVTSTPTATAPCGGALAASLAKELGLDTATVKAALAANRPSPGQPPTDAQKASLAAALGISTDRLDALMQEYGPKHGPRLPIAQIAKETGKTEAEVKAAFEANRPAEGQRPTDAQKAATAAALGISTDRLDALMQEYGGKRDPHPPIAQIAKATGKSETEVRAAFEANRPAPGQRPSDAQKAATAAALGISTSQLDALLHQGRS